jgi:hypothetical protein
LINAHQRKSTRTRIRGVEICVRSMFEFDPKS